METRERRPSPVDRQLEAYRESWQKDHTAAMECREWEDVVAVGIATCKLLQQREDAWRERVFRGTLAFDPADDFHYREQFSLWLNVTEALLQDVVPKLQCAFGLVDGAEGLRECVSAVRTNLAHWEPARISAAVGLREMTLSAEEAAAFDQLIEEAKGKPSEKPSGPPMQEMSAQEFLRRKRSKP